MAAPREVRAHREAGRGDRQSDLADRALHPADRTPHRVRPAPATTALLLLAQLATAALACGIGARLRDDIAGLATATVDRLVEVGILTAGLALTAWLAGWLLVAVVCAGARGLGARWRAGERLIHRWAPTVVRRALVVLVGTGIGLTAATGAQAGSPDDLTVDWVTTAIVESSPAVAGTTPPESSVPVVTSVAADALGAVVESRSPSTDAGTASSTPVTVVVRPGDSLWRIAARDLPTGAGDAAIAAAWPDWYAANADVIGADPDLLEPGQTLRAPAPATDPATDGAP